MSASLDRRINAVRADLADIALAGRVVAARYAAPITMRAAVSSPIYAEPDAGSVCISELLHGEAFAVFDRIEGWAWGQCGSDAYVGWLPEAVLVSNFAPSHIVAVPQALLFSHASIKAPVVAMLPLGAALEATPHDANFLAVGEAFLHRRHLELPRGDAVDLAAAFIGTPYRWGGRTRAGLDCSGLTQVVLQAHGLDCPRDSDQQLAAFPAIPLEERRRGDLVGFPGHVGILVDRDTLLHANAYWMTTLAEPLAVVVARLQPLHDKPISGVVRPPCEAAAASL